MLKCRLKDCAEPAIHFLIWSSFFLILLFQVRTIGPFRKQDGSVYLPLIWSTIFNLSLFYFNSLYLIPRFISKQRYKIYLLYVIVLYLSIVLLNSAFDHFYSISLFSTEKEPFLAEITLNTGSKIFILSLSLGYGLTKNWINSEKIRQQLAKDKLVTELKYLKAQINPHFLFNTLNMAYASAIKHADNPTADIIEKLSALMRYVLYEGNQDEVPLAKEINYIDNYVNLQLQRLSPEIISNIKYEVNGNWLKNKIAPMILMPFIENVFKHGVILSKTPVISIQIFFTSNTLMLKTKNLKSSYYSAQKPESGIGLRNARERLELLYPNKHKLQITETGNIFQVNLELQLQ